MTCNQPSGYAQIHQSKRFGSEVGGHVHFESCEHLVEQIVVQTLQHAQVGMVEHPAGGLHALQHASFVARPSLDDYAAVDAEARRLAAEFLKVRRPENNPAK